MVSAPDSNSDEAPATSSGAEEPILGPHSKPALSAEAGTGTNVTTIHATRYTPIVVEVDVGRHCQANLSLNITIRLETTSAKLSIKVRGNSDEIEARAKHLYQCNRRDEISRQIWMQFFVNEVELSQTKLETIFVIQRGLVAKNPSLKTICLGKICKISPLA